MAAVREDLTIEQGSTWSTGWAVTYSATGEVADLAAIDNTWTVASQIRTGAGGALIYNFLASVDADGNVVIGVPFADSDEWTWRTAYYDVEVTNADESVRLRVAQGQVKLSPEVTE